MPQTVLYMSMSLDGFIAGPDDSRELGLGRNGERLHDWIAGPKSASGEDVFPNPAPGVNAQVMEELNATGAVLIGRRTYDIVEGWGGNHHGVPIVVVTHHPPTESPKGPSSITFVTDIVRASEVAKEFAGDRDVLVHGASTAQSALRAGVLDEMEIHVIPVLLGEGRRLFEHLGSKHRELELVRALTGPGVIHHRYRVLYQ